VTVTATRHFSASDTAPEVRLVPQGSTLSIDVTEQALEVRPAFVDYVIEVPASAGASVRSTSGEVQIVGVSGPTVVQTASGSVDLSSAVVSDARVTTTSGDVRLQLTGQPSTRVDVRTSSGDIRAIGLPLSPDRRDARSFTTTLGSGASRLDVRTASGDITLSR